MTTIKELAVQLARTMRDQAERRTAKSHDELLKRIEALERAPLSYEGVHEVGKVYDKGQFVTFHGSIWHANRKTARVPGDSDAWTLAVKRGRDGK